MKHYYSTLYHFTGNGIVLTHSDMYTKDHSDRVAVYFERDNNHGFDFAEGYLPECIFHKHFGFSEDEILYLKDYLLHNAILIWDYSQKGGGENA